MAKANVKMHHCYIREPEKYPVKAVNDRIASWLAMRRNPGSRATPAYTAALLHFKEQARGREREQRPAEV